MQPARFARWRGYGPLATAPAWDGMEPVGQVPPKPNHLPVIRGDRPRQLAISGSEFAALDAFLAMACLRRKTVWDFMELI